MSAIRKGRINLECPPDWRNGQTLLNFLGWLSKTHDELSVFHMEDPEFEKIYSEFLAYTKGET